MQASEGRDKKRDSAILGVFTEDGLPPDFSNSEVRRRP